jgi:hypothetical protein
MAEFAVTKEPCQHRERTRSESLIDKWFLPVQRFKSGTTGQGILATLKIDDLGIEFTHGPQPIGPPPVARVQRLPENILPAGGIVAEIEPLSKRFSVYV